MNKIFKITPVLMLSLFIASFASCKIGVNVADEKKAEVRFSVNAARTVLPDFDGILTDLVDFRLQVNPVNGDASEYSYTDYEALSEAKIEVVEGSCDFTLSAKYYFGGKSTFHSFMANTTKTLVANVENTVEFAFDLSVLNFNAEYGKGTITIGFTFPDEPAGASDVTLEKIKFRNYDSLGDFEELVRTDVNSMIEGDIYYLMKDERDCGVYFIEFYFRNSEGKLAIVKDLYIIGAGGVTAKIHEVKAEDFIDEYTITYHYGTTPEGTNYGDVTAAYLTMYGYKLDSSVEDEVYAYTWYEDEECTIPASDTDVGKASGDKEYWAKWEERRPYVLNYFWADTNSDSMAVPYPYIITDVDLPSEENKIYVWYTDLECENKMPAEYKLTGDTAVYAQIYDYEEKTFADGRCVVKTHPEGVEVTFNYVQGLDNDLYTLELTEKSYGMVLKGQLTGIPTAGNPSVTHIYPITEKGVVYDFDLVIQGPNLDYTVYSVSCRSGGGKLNEYFNFTEGWNTQAIEASSTSYTQKLTYPILNNFKDYKNTLSDVYPVFVINSGLADWSDTDWVYEISFKYENFADVYRTLITTGLDLESYIWRVGLVTLSSREKYFTHFNLQFTFNDYPETIFSTKDLTSSDNNKGESYSYLYDNYYPYTITFEYEEGLSGEEPRKVAPGTIIVINKDNVTFISKNGEKTVISHPYNEEAKIITDYVYCDMWPNTYYEGDVFEVTDDVDIQYIATKGFFVHYVIDVNGTVEKTIETMDYPINVLEGTYKSKTDNKTYGINWYTDEACTIPVEEMEYEFPDGVNSMYFYGKCTAQAPAIKPFNITISTDSSDMFDIKYNEDHTVATITAKYLGTWGLENPYVLGSIDDIEPIAVGSVLEFDPVKFELIPGEDYQIYYYSPLEEVLILDVYFTDAN